jgi:hypothetical protein
MKRFLSFLVLISALGGAIAEEVAKVKMAEVLRSVSASYVDDKGLSAGNVTLKKGDSYEVVKEDLSSVVVEGNGQFIKIPKDAVRVTEAAPPAPGSGVLRIISAKYGKTGDREYEVKQELKKRIPAGSISSPVKILVSDALLRAKAAAANQTTGVVNGNVVTVDTRSFILTVTYEWDGKRLKKEAMEGQTIELP